MRFSLAVGVMEDKIMYTIGNILMVVEAVAFAFLVWEWRKAKKEDREDENNT